MDVDWFQVLIIVVVVLILLLVCTRHRRKIDVTKKVIVEEEIVTTQTSFQTHTMTQRVFDDVDRADRITVTQQTKTMAERAEHAPLSRHANSMMQIFNTTDLKVVAEEFNSLDEVSSAIRKAGLEHCNLIFGVDYTASNYQQGKKTFGGKCLHDIEPNEQNPYQKVIAVLGETLEPFDSDGAIPAFGFGDMTTRDKSIFSLKTDGLCKSFKEVLQIYNNITPRVRLSGPTNFAPLIRQAIGIVKAAKTYNILVIVADGQVTSERETIESIEEASNYPMSIIMVGVGDGPWDTMDEFDQKLPSRLFDNFHFVNFSEVTSNVKNANSSFALHALMEIPDQFKSIKELGLLKM
ncbi:E3 ubiquitin-protein ligase RGLG4-like [Gigantopelta aegis]|uniref:E3 ubiquitin-protein ligase RGLG4-like n=1 Tax=Gigantopelta aegis TaxID=1735272 RepID=UPI001B888A19|nr:E3 ubiquitin-protein ligase RGLG4-like [Gigantopelta aegis]XP_041377698.1 E3 ubiquitin-protein ligase RGLG4-like [Gigantopelta aegis]XP_041377699.1 E3 ubiquitin-protein ligase RGLG4-like [Gigantopelta aegis]